MASEPRLQTLADMRIVFDGPPSHEAPRFIEVNDSHGRSIRPGYWVQNGDYWELRFDRERDTPTSSPSAASGA